MRGIILSLWANLSLEARRKTAVPLHSISQCCPIKQIWTPECSLGKISTFKRRTKTRKAAQTRTDVFVNSAAPAIFSCVDFVFRSVFVVHLFKCHPSIHPSIHPFSSAYPGPGRGGSCLSRNTQTSHLFKYNCIKWLHRLTMKSAIVDKLSYNYLV